MTQDQEIKTVRDLVRTQSDIAGWLILAGSCLAMGMGWVDPFPDGFAFVVLALITLIGSDFVKGLRVGSLSIEGSKSDD